MEKHTLLFIAGSCPFLMYSCQHSVSSVHYFFVAEKLNFPLQLRNAFVPHYEKYCEVKCINLVYFIRGEMKISPIP